MSSLHPIRLVSWIALQKQGCRSLRPALLPLWQRRAVAACGWPVGYAAPFAALPGTEGALGSLLGQSLGTESLGRQCCKDAGVQCQVCYALPVVWLGGIFPCLPGDCAWARGICWEATSHVRLKALVSSRQEQKSHRCLSAPAALTSKVSEEDSTISP